MWSAGFKAHPFLTSPCLLCTAHNLSVSLRDPLSYFTEVRRRGTEVGSSCTQRLLASALARVLTFSSLPPLASAPQRFTQADYMVSMDPITTRNPLGDDGPELGVTVSHYMNTGGERDLLHILGCPFCLPPNCHDTCTLKLQSTFFAIRRVARL
jgi:hypothetical protein